jgi:GrpB-like predicted nucleotidyltransferase (UPF0157 family)
MRQYLQQHNPRWALYFNKSAVELKNTLGHDALAIHHIGSTSIPGILAKPIVDILIETPDLTRFSEQTALMVSCGYESKGEYGIPGRLYFRKNDYQGNRTHHIHVFEAGCEHVKKHLAFRDYLRAHPERAQNYSNLKADMTNSGKIALPYDYQDCKAPFIETVLKDALEWYGQTSD